MTDWKRILPKKKAFFNFFHNRCIISFRSPQDSSTQIAESTHPKITGGPDFMGPIANSRLYNMKSLVTSRSATVVSKLPNDQTNGNVNLFINKCVDRLAWLLRPEFSLRRNYRHFWQKKEIRLQGCNLESQIKGTFSPS